jgi:hypothetical protein
VSALRLSWALIEQRKRNKPRFRNRLFGPLAAALGFTCEGLTAARTERCTMLAMQCSAGHLRAVWSHGTCRAFSCATRRAGHCAMLRAVQRWALCNTARCASQGALHYILVVGLWQRRNSSFRKTHTFGHVLSKFYR